MDKLILSAKTRGTSKVDRSATRRASLVPGVIYGHDFVARPVAVTQIELERIYRQAGFSTLIDLNIEGEKSETIVIHDIQRHPVTGLPLHVDLYRVKMDEKMTAEVPLVFVGVAPAVKELSAILVQHLDHLKVECLPKDLPHELPVELSSLTAYGSEILVKDLVVPAGVKIEHNLDDVVVVTQEAKAEISAEVATDGAAAEKAAIEGQEVEKKGKEEEEVAE